MLDDLILPRFPVRARISTGIKAGGKPRSVDYFVCQDEGLLEEVTGEASPRELRIVLPYDRAEQVWSTSLERWGGAVLMCSSRDGKNAKRRLAGGDFDQVSARAEPVEVECGGRVCPDWRQKCKPTGRLYFFLEGEGQRDQVYRYVTNSFESVQRLAAVFSLATEGLMGRAGTLVVEWVAAGAKQYPIVSLRLDSDSPTVGEVQQERALRIRVRDLLVELDQPVTDDVRAWVGRVGYGPAVAALEARLAARS